MALKTIRIGSMVDIFQYDDADYDSAFEADAPIKAGTPADPTDVLRLQDIAATILGAAYPIGSVFLSVVSTDPNTLLGFGTWARIAEGQFLVGFKTGDADFDPVENVGGSKTHQHDVDVANATSTVNDTVETVDNNGDISTVDVAADGHTHDVDPASVSSGDNNNLPPFFVIYAWKRTA
jgi:Baseplate structural protein Gp10, C-terminal domain